MIIIPEVNSKKMIFFSKVDVDEERYLMQQESNRRADSRYKQALEKQRREQMFQEYEQKYHIISR